MASRYDVKNKKSLNQIYKIFKKNRYVRKTSDYYDVKHEERNSKKRERDLFSMISVTDIIVVK